MKADFVAADMLLGRDDPFRRALLDRMRGVAGRGLEQLRELAGCVAREQILQAGRSLLRLLERAQRQADQRAADLHDDAGIGQRRAAAGGKTDRALAAHQEAFDLAVVLDRHRERHERGAAGEVDDGDAVAGVMQDVVRGELDRLQVRREQLEILGAELRSRSFLGRPVTLLVSGSSLAGNRHREEPYVSAQEPTVPK